MFYYIINNSYENEINFAKLKKILFYFKIFLIPMLSMGVIIFDLWFLRVLLKNKLKGPNESSWIEMLKDGQFIPFGTQYNDNILYLGKHSTYIQKKQNPGIRSKFEYEICWEEVAREIFFIFRFVGDV